MRLKGGESALEAKSIMLCRASSKRSLGIVVVNVGSEWPPSHQRHFTPPKFRVCRLFTSYSQPREFPTMTSLAFGEPAWSFKYECSKFQSQTCQNMSRQASPLKDDRSTKRSKTSSSLEPGEMAPVPEHVIEVVPDGDAVLVLSEWSAAPGKS